MKTNQAFGILRSRRGQLREIKCAAVITLFGGVGHAFKLGRRMVELACNFNLQVGMSRDGVVVNRDAAIGRDKFTTFGQDQRINFKRAGFDAARCGE